MQWCIAYSAVPSWALRVPLRAPACRHGLSASIFRVWDSVGEPHARPASTVRVDELDAPSLHDAADGGDSAEVRLGQATFDAVQGPQRYAAFSRKPRHRPIQ